MWAKWMDLSKVDGLRLQYPLVVEHDVIKLDPELAAKLKAVTITR